MQVFGAGMLVGSVRLHYGSQIKVIPAENTSQQTGNSLLWTILPGVLSQLEGGQQG